MNRTLAPHAPRSNRHRPGMAVGEVLVVVVVLVLLLVLFLAWLGQARSSSRRDVCAFRQQQTAGALLQFAAAKGHFPGYRNLQGIDDEGQRRATGWVFVVLPYLGWDAEKFSGETPNFEKLAKDAALARPYRPLFEKYGPSGPDATRGRTPSARILELLCPDDAQVNEPARANPLSYVLNAAMPDAPFSSSMPADWTANGVSFNLFDEGAAPTPLVSTAFLEAHDGLRSTLLLTENTDAGPWSSGDEAKVGFVWVAGLVNGQPAPGKQLLRINEARGTGDGSIRFARPASYHVGGVNAIFADGKQQFLDQNIDYLVFTQLMTSDGQNAKLPGTNSPVPKPY